MTKFSKAMNKRFTSVSKAAMDVLLNYNWPGNVREPENTVERALVIGRELEIQAPDFPLQLTASAPQTGQSLEDVERAHVLHALESCGWNQTRAARTLKIDRVTLYNKIKKYGFRKVSSLPS